MWQAAGEDSQHGRPALAEVIRRYWQPLYSFARRRGLSSEDAEDATQEFLSRIISGDLLANADPAKGRFRTFLLTAWKRFLVDQFRREAAQRRGGAAQFVPLDVDRVERSWQELKSREPDPERLFMLGWATSLLDEVQLRLRRDYASADRSKVLNALLPNLTSTLDAAAYRQVAQELSLSTSAVKVALHRLRQRFGATLREVIAETVDDPAEVDAEIQELLHIITRG